VKCAQGSTMTVMSMFIDCHWRLNRALLLEDLVERARHEADVRCPRCAPITKRKKLLSNYFFARGRRDGNQKSTLTPHSPEFDVSVPFIHCVIRLAWHCAKHESQGLNGTGQKKYPAWCRANRNTLTQSCSQHWFKRKHGLHQPDGQKLSDCAQ